MKLEIGYALLLFMALVTVLCVALDINKKPILPEITDVNKNSCLYIMTKYCITATLIPAVNQPSTCIKELK